MKTVEEYVEDLRDPDAQLEAILALAELGEAAVQPLIEVLQNDDAESRASAAAILALQMLGEVAVQPLIGSLQHDDSMAREKAVFALSQPDESAVVQTFIQALHDDRRPKVREFAANYLERLVDIELKDGKAKALKNLENLEHDQLIKTLRDPHASARKFAAFGLGKLGHSASIQPLIEALADEEAIVRLFAVRALAELGDAVAAKPLTQALRDDDAVVRRFAAKTLKQLGDAAAAQPLLEALRDPDEEVRNLAAEALPELGDITIVQPLIEALRDDDAGIRSNAAYILGNLRAVSAVHPLIETLQDGDAGVRWSAIFSLGELGDAAAVQPLIETLWDDNGENRSAAADAIHKLGIGPAVIRSIEFPPEYKAAGLQILNHFDDVIRSKYAEVDVKISITQNGGRVTMRIETVNGEQLEKIEKTLEQYSLVVQGEIEPEELLDDRDAILQLKNQLGLAAHQIQMQKEMLAFKDADIGELRRLLSQAITTQPPIQVLTQATASPIVDVGQSVTISKHVATLQGSLADLAENLPRGSAERAWAEDLRKQLDTLPEDPAETKKSPTLARVRRFVEDLGDSKSGLGKTVKGMENLARIAADVAARFHDLVQWMG